MAVSVEERRAPTATLLILVGLTALALALRLPSLGGALWGDELATNYVVYGFGADSFGSILVHGKEATPPLFFLLTWLTKGFDGTEGLRLVSLIAGLAAVPLTYLVGRESVGRVPGLVGAALVALSPFQIFYATEARAYELFMLVCLLAAWTLLCALRSGRTGWWVGYAVSAALAMYTHYAAVFVLAGIFCWAFFARPGSRRALLLATAGAALLFLPWLPEFIDDTGKQAAKNIELLHPLSPGVAKNDLLRTWFGSPLFGLGDLPGDAGMALIGTGIAIGLLGVVLMLRRAGGSWRPSAAAVFVLILAFAPPVGAALHNVVAPSIFTPRNLIASWPGFALLLGALAAAGPAFIRTASIALLLAGFALGAAQMLDDTNRRPEIAEAADYIEAAGDPGSPVVELPQFTPGPQTAFEAALAPKGQGLPEDRTVYPLGLPSFADRLELNREGESFSQAGAPVSPEAIATRAARQAGDGDLFVVGPSGSLAAVRAFPGPLSSFLDALPPRFHEVDSRRFAGPVVFGFGVHVFRGNQAPSHNRPLR
jgi:mannosyltransferase